MYLYFHKTHVALVVKFNKISLQSNSLQPTLNLKRNRPPHWSINKLITAYDRIGDTCCRIETITGHQFMTGWVHFVCLPTYADHTDLHRSHDHRIILMGKRELVALLSSHSSCLVMVVWLFFAMPWVCLQFVIVVFSDHATLFTAVCGS